MNGQCVPLCGNAKVDAQEVCDDGNSANDDACTNACKLGTNQVCRSHDQCGTGLCLNERCTPCNTTSQCPANRLCLSRQCVDAPMCGNAVPEWTERCDDGDRDDLNSCSNKCRRGNGEACLVNRDCASLFCFNGVCQACTSNDQCGGAQCLDGRCEDLCGNGKVDFGEQCDQGADNSDVTPDRCRMDCLSPRVGDGVKDANEECDDGNTVSGDGCDRYGRLENGTPGGPLVIDLSPLAANVNGTGGPCNSNNECPVGNFCFRRRCINAPMCMNGVQEGVERCDDGDQDDLNACSNKCRRGNGEACQGNRDCASLRCADGICQACANNDQCGGANCIDGRCEDLCGNGRIDAGEQCDNGSQNHDYLPDHCRTDCLRARMGDGIKDLNEECDDGNLIDGDGCDHLGRLEGGSVRPPRNTDVGPAAVIVMITGAAAGFAWMRRRVWLPS